MALASPHIAVAELRHLLARMESYGPAHAGSLLFGVDEVDSHLPGGGLQRGHLHEVLEGGTASSHAALATLFAAGILGRLPGPVLWCLRGRDLFAPALARVGLHPDRVIYCETWKDRDVRPQWKKAFVARALPATFISTRSSLRHGIFVKKQMLSIFLARNIAST
ncbi:MAG TPA: hypothetical protein VIJ52_00880 [Pseudolabrys sp.]